MSSIHLRRLENRRARLTDRIIDHATREELTVADLRDVALPWYAIRNQAGNGRDDGDEFATIFIYDEIGGSAGVSAKQFAKDLEAITAPEIRVRINSPGGSVFDAIAIHNSLLHHPARVVVYVDSLAASAASVVAMAGDETIMMPGSQLMIHDASAVLDGNAEQMRQLAIFLDRQSDNIADLYRMRGGGDAAQWRALMLAETWMFAAEAVEMRLADRAEERESPAPEVEQEPELEEAMTRSFDLTSFRYPGREHAPAPQPAQVGRPVTAGRRSTAPVNARRRQAGSPGPPEEPQDGGGQFTRAYKDQLADVATDPSGSPIPFVAATPGLKRDGLELRPAGWRTRNFGRNPVVLWVHDHHRPPIGVAAAEPDDQTLRALVTYDQEDPFAVRVESKYRRGFLSAVSVGWDFVDHQGIPLDWRRLTAAQIRDRVFYDLTELSACPVPSDPDALIARQRAALRNLSRELTDLFDDMERPDGQLTAPQVQQAVLDECQRLGIPLDLDNWQPIDPECTAIPPHTTPLDDNRDATWDAGAEVRQAEGRQQLRRMHAWVDGDADPEAKGSYKLPHHRADGTLVWRGLTAAMGRLNQAGTDIDDRPGTYAHLARHYRQFGEEPPPLANLADHDHPPAAAGVDPSAARTVLAAFNLDGSNA